MAPMGSKGASQTDSSGSLHFGRLDTRLSNASTCSRWSGFTTRRVTVISHVRLLAPPLPAGQPRPYRYHRSCHGRWAWTLRCVKSHSLCETLELQLLLTVGLGTGRHKPPRWSLDAGTSGGAR